MVEERDEPALAVEASFDAFVGRGSARLLRSVFLLTGDRGHAEDLLQATLVRTARHWTVACTAPDAYAYRVLVNLAHDHRRWLRRRVVERPLDGLARTPTSAGDPIEAVLERNALLAAVATLARRQREAVVLRFFAGLSVEGTAGAMGVSAGAVKTHTSRALAHLRAALTEVPDGH